MKLRFSLEYQCYPLWIYSETDDFIDNNFPDELKANMSIDSLLDDIQLIFDGLFIDDGISFEYKGFEDEIAKSNFNEMVLKAIKLIEEFYEGDFTLENRVDIDKL